MELKEAFLTNNPRYKQAVEFIPSGLMLHSVGVNQPSAEVFIKQWNKSTYRTSCVHGIIDANTGVIYQTLPWTYKGWHGGGKSNNTHIGVEMGEPSGIKYGKGATFVITGDKSVAQAAAKRTYDAAVELFAMLCMTFYLDPMKNIVSHSEGHKLGIATAHADPEHLWTGLGMSLTMDAFRDAVRKKMVSGTATVQPDSKASNKKVNYRVRCVVSNLNIRETPTTSAASKGHLAPGAYTIVEETPDGKWGLLRAYETRKNGWIYLQYVNKI